MHHIQHYILNVLAATKWARFRDMRPPKVDSNVYSYHLKLLMKQGLIEKHESNGYQLSPRGMTQVDRMSANELRLRLQPKIVTMIIVYNEQGKVLLLAKKKQPFIGAWTFPSGKFHIEDGNPRTSATRELMERIAVEPNPTLNHIADIYLYSSIGTELVSAILAHVLTITIRSDEVTRQDVAWTDETDRAALQLAPGVEEICTLAKNTKEKFTYAEYVLNS